MPTNCIHVLLKLSKNCNLAIIPLKNLTKKIVSIKKKKFTFFCNPLKEKIKE